MYKFSRSLYLQTRPENQGFLISSSCFRKQVMKSIIVRELKEKIRQKEVSLQKLMSDMDRIWEDTGLDPKGSSYLVEKTMRFELAQKNVNVIFLVFKDLIENYKKLCQELEKTDLE